MFNKKEIKPIKSFEADCLGLEKYVIGICSNIEEVFNLGENLSVGIVGKWGDGKTSAINLCTQFLRQKYKSKEKFNLCRFFIIILIFVIFSGLILNNKSVIYYLGVNAYSFFIKYLGSNINILLLSTLFIFLNFGSLKPFFIKTFSFLMKFLKSFVLKKQLMVLHFSPWDCSSNKQMVQEYLTLLANELCFLTPTIYSKLIKYSKIINNENLTNFLNLVFEKYDISTLKQEIFKILSLSDKKIVVVIDDFDRITGQEIFNMLKVIGSIANFPNVVNVVAYDKEYICENLKSYFESSGEAIDAQKYLRKIIPCEFPLPKISYEKIFDIFIEEVDNIVKDSQYHKIELTCLYANTLGGYLNNIRDLKQFLCAFEFHYNIFKNQGVNININDLLFITSIKIFNFELWQDLYSFGKDYFVSDIGLPSYINYFSEETKAEENFKIKLKLDRRSPNELNILASLIPRMRKFKEFSICSIEHDSNYDIKRLWSNIESFNLYFEFNPSISRISEILGDLLNKDFCFLDFNKLLQTDTDWSDLKDILFSTQYRPKLNETLLLNFIEFLLRSEFCHEKLKFRGLKRGYVELLGKINATEFNNKLTDLISRVNININALLETVYVYYLYTKNSKGISDIRILTTKEKEDFFNILKPIKNLINNINISEISVTSIYYLCLGYSLLDKNIKEIVQQKILDDIKVLENDGLLQYLLCFLYELSEGRFSLDILTTKEIFNLESIKILKQKLIMIKENEVIMQDSKYKFLFVEQDKLIDDEGYSHIISIFLI